MVKNFFFIPPILHYDHKINESNSFSLIPFSHLCLQEVKVNCQSLSYYRVIMCVFFPSTPLCLRGEHRLYLNIRKDITGMNNGQITQFNLYVQQFVRVKLFYKNASAKQGFRNMPCKVVFIL